ncbi:MAG: hypothetical protein ACK4M7_10745, partial [Burkholderiales bacterium]
EQMQGLAEQVQLLTSQLDNKALKSNETQGQVVSQLSSFCQRIAKTNTQENNNSIDKPGPQR